MKGVMMKKLIYVSTSILLAMIISTPMAGAHCQIPCGIYDDQLRAQLIAEHATTIEKSMKQIMELSKAAPGPANYNQLVRWIMNKEKHAQNIIDTISDYFLTQRVKPNQDNYTERLVKHHAVIVAAMNTKQHADEKYVDQLERSIGALKPYYPKTIM